MRLQLNQAGDVVLESIVHRVSLSATMTAAAISLFAVECVTPPCMAQSIPERGIVSLKQLDYVDSQPGRDRVKVKATAVDILAPIAGEWAISATAVSDGISGASPAYHNSAIIKLVDRRNAIDGQVTRYFQDASVTIGANYSKESDYLSRGLSFQGSLLSGDRNTTWTLGIGFNKDKIDPNNHIVAGEKKHVADFLLSLSQVLTISDIVQINLGISKGDGYHSDPYKVFDNRPRERNSQTLTTRWNHHNQSLDSTARMSYRYFSDSWGIKAHTLTLEYVQNIAPGWIITPLLRVYSQSRAKFYVDAGPIDFPFPPNPPDNARYFSEDQRMSAYGAHTYGLKIAKHFGEDWLVDLKYEQYTQRASWRLFGEGSPGLLPFYARSVQVGISKQF